MRDNRDYITPEDAARMIAAARNEEERLLLEILWASGRRVSEVVGELGISFADIDRGNSLIMFTILKKREAAGQPRTQKLKPVDSDTIKKLCDYCAQQGVTGGSKVFPKSRRWAHRAFVYAATASGVRAANGHMPHPHHFRHSFAVRAVRAADRPADLLALQDILDHEDFKTTQVYTQFNPEEAKALIEKMGRKA